MITLVSVGCGVLAIALIVERFLFLVSEDDD